MQGTPHEIEDAPPDREKRRGEQGEAEQQAAGAPEAPTGPSPTEGRDEPGSERDPDREGPTPDSENPGA